MQLNFRPFAASQISLSDINYASAFSSAELGRGDVRLIKTPVIQCCGLACQPAMSNSVAICFVGGRG